MSTRYQIFETDLLEFFLFPMYSIYMEVSETTLIVTITMFLSAQCFVGFGGIFSKQIQIFIVSFFFRVMVSKVAPYINFLPFLEQPLITDFVQCITFIEIQLLFSLSAPQFLRTLCYVTSQNRQKSFL